MRNQDAFLLYPSATVTTATTTYTAAVDGEFFASAIIALDVTVRVGSQTITVTVQVYDPASDSWLNADAFDAATTVVAMYAYFVGAYGAGATGKVSTDLTGTIPMPLPRKWRLKLVTDTEDDVTFSVGVIPLGGLS